MTNQIGNQSSAEDTVNQLIKQVQKFINNEQLHSSGNYKVYYLVKKTNRLSVLLKVANSTDDMLTQVEAEKIELGNKINKLKEKIDNSQKNAQKKLKDLDNKINSCNEKIQTLNEEIEAAKNNIELTERKIDDLKNKVNNFEKENGENESKVKGLREKAEELKKKDNSKNPDEVVKVNKTTDVLFKIEQTEKEINDLVSNVWMNTEIVKEDTVDKSLE